MDGGIKGGNANVGPLATWSADAETVSQSGLLNGVEAYCTTARHLG